MGVRAVHFDASANVASSQQPARADEDETLAPYGVVRHHELEFNILRAAVIEAIVGHGRQAAPGRLRHMHGGPGQDRELTGPTFNTCLQHQVPQTRAPQ